MKLLLEKGANVDYGDACNQTPMSLAIKNCHETVVRLLQQKRRRLV